ncbi:1D-myo-inosityl-2-acetamido-2-deoxy-alpha-D-glucopyranosidede acetylase [Segniliparus rotundus DSM 44985]|uniref:1D-myo-inositol 2-acetamido-2-deoxy-alpha-D-glucopyranoside deacetylase n=1 Tax=Segniliparus rotundus (strain ATCC BAA-972 / CDC 1076 / CIP 108378 / DSM 44985 / JCM 13578) TaxID=640132 RepID=MSHB_SEGRD|nr:N-acetyl-1-D-myo-inositol-2-amino-2-deoxy-alpha-D-glucopyranoside deacetylase [Segniliparus rotundus]D6ZE32.1 RecName: Full=1D-myo-inositol 2-acetamido-2-deoxy-alpha-D-glucopyranoside deacetylase; Short=GlcNAc-Ins deacetylase; AltName: Full=N-acetyl-1-D-myo-inositol 2-amino-2-deoxy-alpha-D-glucopyranoside deacetylase [Segniliparus rotundus DSM 44985]ADG97312.1 1D-myo-inosityl-2-acetamido-2-deoxy-alpha-D-glucopyranosidede acetylase [Segniliparus rotundus DSM 44985]
MNDNDSPRALFVFAHPDDETILSGGTMARLAAEGAHVSLLTCTLGEEGEVIAPELRELAADRADQLGGWRIAELRSALDRLGSPRGARISQHWLAGPGRWRDSGMAAGRNTHPRAFIGGDFGEQARAAAKTIREVRPHVVVTHDPEGGYGHRDHIYANRLVVEAVKIAAAETHSEFGAPWQVKKLYWTGIGESAWRRAIKELGRRAIPDGFELVHADVAKPRRDEEITTVVDIGDYRAAKLAALAAHATQITVCHELAAFALSNKALTPVPAEEHFLLVPLRFGAVDNQDLDNRNPNSQPPADQAREDHLLTGLGFA